ncbi:MAG: hypothetical protein OER96_10115 [Gammaproteobacteria bacterium]|nr:hypothetical protein [Gammaproteobacteria bacterium]
MKLPIPGWQIGLIALLVIVALVYSTGLLDIAANTRPKLTEFCKNQVRQMELTEVQEQQDHYHRCIEDNRKFDFF